VTRARLATSVLIGATLLAACTSKATTSGTPTVLEPTGTSSSTPSTTADSPTDTPTLTTSTAPTTSASASHSTSPKPPSDDCTAAQLTIRVLPSSGAQQQEFALITFTNSSTKACSLFGYPGVSLRRSNALLGSPAQRNFNAKANRVHLAPGGQAKAMLTDFSACQAPLSDTVRIYPPNLTAFIDRPTQLRGCQLVIDPVSPA
jgi:hypothetical protein